MLTKIKWNDEGFREVLKSDQIVRTMEEIAMGKVASAPVSGYKTSTHYGTNRANVSIYADTDEAVQDNYNNNTLARMVGG